MESVRAALSLERCPVGFNAVVDMGSKLLQEHTPADVRGRVLIWMLRMGALWLMGTWCGLGEVEVPHLCPWTVDPQQRVVDELCADARHPAPPCAIRW